MSGSTNPCLMAATCVHRRASDSSSGWLDDQHSSSLTSRHQLTWSHGQQQRAVDVSPQPGAGGDRPPHRLPHAVTVDESTTTRPGPDRHHGCGRQLGTMTRQPLITFTQPTSLAALVEYVLDYFNLSTSIR